MRGWVFTQRRWGSLVWLVALAMLGACGGGGGGGGGAGPGPGPDAAVPVLQSTVPANGAFGIAVGSTIQMTFSVAMDAAAIDGALSIEPERGLSCTWNAGNTTATCVPNPALLAAALYTVRVSTAARSAAGVHLAAERTFSFTTAPPAVGDEPVPAPPGTPSCTLGGPGLLGACKLGT